MNPKDLEMYLKIRNHLGELHEKWMHDPERDSHKSNEGYVGILLRAPNWFECGSDKKAYVNAPLQIAMVEVYSYLFGPHRLHEFNSLEEAWEAVKNW